MNAAGWLNGDACVRLTLTLVHFLWQGTAVALLAGLAMLALRRASPRLRYGVLVAALALMTACVPVTFAVLDVPGVSAPPERVSGMEPGLPAEVEGPPTLETLSPPLPTTDVAVGPVGIASEPALPAAADDKPEIPVAATVEAADQPADRWQRVAPYVAAVYLVGVLAMLGRLALGLGGGRRLRRRSQPVQESQLLAALARQVKALGLSFTPAVACCRQAVVPTVVGVLRPTILLPLSLASGLSPEQVEALLSHELAHIRRCDHLVNLVQRVIEALLFFHPAVWFISRGIRAEREHCCDDLVVAAGGEAAAYADSLVRVAELSRPAVRKRRALAGATLHATGRASALGRRILRLLGEPPHERMRVRRSWALALGLITVIALLTASYLHGRAEPSAAAPPGVNDGYIEFQVAIRDRAYRPGEPIDTGNFTTYYAFYWKVPQKDEPGAATIRANGRDLLVRWSGVRSLPRREKGVQLKDFYWDINAPVVDPFGDLRGLGRHREALRTFTPDFEPALTPIVLGGRNRPDAPLLVVRTRWVERPSLPETSIVVYSHRDGPTDGCTTPMWLSGWVRSGYPGAVSELTWRYVGRAPHGDQYEVTRMFPAWTDKASRSTKTVTYAGVALTVFEDQAQRIVIRPSTAKGATLPPATDKQRREAKELVDHFSIDVHGRPSVEQIHGQAAGLMAVLRDRAHYDEYSRYKAFELLSRAKPEAFRAVVLEALGDANHLIRGAAVHQLDEIVPGDKLVGEYVALLSDPYPIVRYNAAECLQRHPSKQHIEDLLSLLADESIEVRGQAVAVLRRWEMPDVCMGLREQAKSPDWRVAGTASYALGSLWGEPVDVGAIERLLDQELNRLTGPPYGGVGLVQGIIKFLGERAQRSSLPVLQKAARHSHRDIRAAAAGAIASVLRAHPEIHPAGDGTTRPSADGWGQAVEGVQVRLRADRTTWREGETPRLRVDARHRERGPFHFEWPDVTCEFEIDGQWYSIGSVGVADLRVRRIHLDRAVRRKDDNTPLQLTRGKHTVRLAIRGRMPGGDRDARWISNPVEIEIRPAGTTRPATQPSAVMRVYDVRGVVAGMAARKRARERPTQPPLLGLRMAKDDPQAAPDEADREALERAALKDLAERIRAIAPETWKGGREIKPWREGEMLIITQTPEVHR